MRGSKNITKIVAEGGADADLIFFDSTIAPYLNRIGLLDDLEGVMTERDITEGAFESGALELIRELSPRGTVTGFAGGQERLRPLFQQGGVRAVGHRAAGGRHDLGRRDRTGTADRGRGRRDAGVHPVRHRPVADRQPARHSAESGRRGRL